MKATLVSAAATFAVADVEKTIDWYQEHLGVDADTFPARPPYQWASIWRDGIELMLLRVEGYEKPDLTPRREGMFDLYVRTSGILDLFAKLDGKVDVLRRPARAPYGMVEFVVRDLNGYILLFGDEAPGADVPAQRE